MKLEKNNKYNRKIALGLATIITSGMILSGCNKDIDVIEVTPTPIIEVTPTATIAPTPYVSPTPTVTPTVTPIIELSYEEEIKLLGIINMSDTHMIQGINVFEYTINDEKKIAFCIINANANEKAGHDVYELFTEEKMFSLDYDIYAFEYRRTDEINCKKITFLNPALEGATLNRGYALYYLVEYFPKYGIELSDSEYKNMIHPDDFNDYLKVTLPNNEIANMYLWAVPKQYRVRADEITLNNIEIEDQKVLVK